MIYTLLYSIGIAVHIAAFVLAFKALRLGQEYFKRSSIFRFFKSRVERKYFITMAGSTGNFFMICAKVPYIFLFKGQSVELLEPIFVMGHLFVAFALLASHYDIFISMKSRGQWCEKNL